MYIYMTQNLINRKIYIGQSKRDIEESKDYYGSGYIVNKAIKKYGKENFCKTILVKNINTKQKLNLLEKYYIKLLKSQDSGIGYNIADGGTGGNTGGMREETKIRKSTIKENGLTEFQEQSRKAQNTMKQNGTDIILHTKRNITMIQENEEGLNTYQRNGKKCSETWKNMSDEEKKRHSDIRSNVWKNKSEAKKNEFRKIRSILAKEQMLNQTDEMREHKREIVLKTLAAGISTFNLKTKIYKRLSEEEFEKSAIIAGAGVKFVTKVIKGDNIIYLYNKNAYKRFSKENNCSENWVKGLSSDKIPFTTLYSKFKHLEGIIRERVMIVDLTEEEITYIEENNYI